MTLKNSLGRQQLQVIPEAAAVLFCEITQYNNNLNAIFIQKPLKLTSVAGTLPYPAPTHKPEPYKNH